MEFRTAVRTELQVKADNKEIDEYFSLLDADKNDSLDVNELKVAFKKLIDAAQGAADEAALMRNKAAKIREKAAFIKEVAEATRACERADARFAELRGVKSVDAKIGEKIISRNLKVAEVMTKWDKSGDGSLEADEFRDAVLELGVEAAPAEIDALFVKLDTDGGGAIDVSELRTFVTKLTDAAKNAAMEMKELEKSTLALRKAATKAQKDLTALKAKDEKEAKEGELAADESAKATQGAKADDKAKKKDEKAAKKKGAAAPS
jgi:Ca2+-binding EF-hand superfamily protein